VYSKGAGFIVKRVGFIMKRAGFITKRAEFIVKRAVFIAKRAGFIPAGYTQIDRESESKTKQLIMKQGIVVKRYPTGIEE